MCLPDAGRTEEDHILPTLDEAEVMQALNLLPPQRGLEGEVEVVELLDDGQAAGAHRRLQPPVIAQLNLRGQQLLDRVGCGQCAPVDVTQNRVKRFQRAGQP